MAGRPSGLLLSRQGYRSRKGAVDNAAMARFPPLSCAHDRSMLFARYGGRLNRRVQQVWTWGYHTWEDSVAKALLLIEHSLSAGSTSERRSYHLAARPCTLA
jgi:hypothetical protein